MDQWLQAPGSIHFHLLIVTTLTVSHLIRSELCGSRGGATEDGSPIYYTSLCNKHMVCFMHLWGMFFIRPAVSMTELSFAHDLDLKLKSLLGTLLTCCSVSVSQSNYLFIYLSIYLYVYLSVCLSVNIYLVCLSLHLCLSVIISVCVFLSVIISVCVCLLSCLYVIKSVCLCQSVCLSVCDYTCLSLCHYMSVFHSVNI